MEKNLDKIEKSDIFRAFEYQDKFNKSGKKIKEQINSIVLPKLNSELTNYSDKANKLLEDCGATPNKEVGRWWTVDRKIAVPFKMFEWCETVFCKNTIHGNFETLSVEDNKDCNEPSSKFEAEKRREYNDCVEMICNILTDIKACEILLRNIEDNNTYKLNMAQILALEF